MIVTEAYKNARRQQLQALTVKELSKRLTESNIKGRSKATTKALKVELLLTECFGAGTDENGSITQNIPEIQPKGLKTAQKSEKELTRENLNKKAQLLGWEIVPFGIYYAIRHQDALPYKFMATARTLNAIARKLTDLKKQQIDL